MAVKILHAADFHLDSPFESLPEEKARRRRAEQRELLERIAELVRDERIELVLLSGDLLDSATSYYETQEVLYRAFKDMNAEIFISPGNHDYYCAKSPYAYVPFPSNVHLFKSPQITCVTLENLGCRVWGAGFNDQYSRPLLPGFSVPDGDYIDLMVLHGDLGGDDYNHIKEADIKASGLHYLALGHIHSFSGFKKAGKTQYAYAGCPEGRGFDETGEKGLITGTVDTGGCALSFRPLGGRAYKIHTVDATGVTNITDAVLTSLPQNTERDIYRILLTGEYGGDLDISLLQDQLSERFFHLTVTDQTRPPRDIWAAAGDDTLRGVFLRRMKEKYDASDNGGKAAVVRAVRYGLAALDNEEGYGA